MISDEESEMSTDIKPAPFFESVVCSRCCGTGNYSFNPINGTRCFGCGGRGHKYTKRGAAALKFYLDSLNKLPQDIKVGELVQVDNVYSKYFIRVQKIEHIDGTTFFEGVNNTKGIVRAGYDDRIPVRVGHTNDEKRAKGAIALDYQSTLTKAGVPSKRKVK